MNWLDMLNFNKVGLVSGWVAVKFGEFAQRSDNWRDPWIGQVSKKRRRNHVLWVNHPPPNSFGEPACQFASMLLWLVPTAIFVSNYWLTTHRSSRKKNCHLLCAAQTHKGWRMYPVVATSMNSSPQWHNVSWHQQFLPPFPRVPSLTAPRRPARIQCHWKSQCPLLATHWNIWPTGQHRPTPSKQNSLAGPLQVKWSAGPDGQCIPGAPRATRSGTSMPTAWIVAQLAGNPWQ